MPRTRFPRPTPRARLQLERLDARVTPAVGAYDVPADITRQFAGVVEFGDGATTDGCTGTLLADGRHILTAAHCITTLDSDPTKAAVGVTVRFDLPEQTAGFRRITIAVPKESIFVHPDWNGDVDDGHDVAVLRLPVLAPFANGSSSIAYSLFTGTNEPGRAFTFVGYGATGTGATGENLIDGRANDIQRLLVDSGAGPFKLTYGGQQTVELQPSASEQEILTALNAIPALKDSLSIRAVSVSGGGRAFDINLSGLDAAAVRRVIGVVESGPTGRVRVATYPASDGFAAQIARLTLNPAAGPTAVLRFGSRSLMVSSSATADEVEAALRQLIEAAGTGVRRIDVDAPPGTSGVYEIAFRNVDYSILTNHRIPTFSSTGAGTVAVLVANDVSGVKRSGVNTFGATAELAGNLDADMRVGDAAGTALLGAGDSGGPAFINGQIAGIASYGDGVAGFGDMSSWARVSAFLPYIYQVTQLDRTQKTKYEAVLDLSFQPVAAGVPHRVEVRQAGGVVRVTLDGVLYFSETASNLSGVKVVGVAGPTTVLEEFGLSVPLTVQNAQLEKEPAPPLPPSPPPPPGPAESRLVATGAGAGGGPRVDVFNPDGSTKFSFFAYDVSFTGGVRVAVGDVTGDGVADIVVAAGPGGGPHVKVYDGTTGAEAFSFFAFEPTVAGGLSVAVGDLDGDGVPSIVIGAGPGGGPRVTVFDVSGGSVAMTGSFFAYEPTFTGGVNVAVSGGRIVVGSGVGGGPVVATFTTDGVELNRVFAFAPTFSGGVDVAAGAGLIAVGPGAGGGSAVQLFTPDLTPTMLVPTFDPVPEGGVTVALKPGANGAELYVGPGAGAAGEIRRYYGPDFARFDVVPFDPNFSGGVFVG